MQPKKRKIISAVAAGTLAVALALTGTFAWQSISQQAKNETMGAINPGGRLHDYFNGSNKDVFVENFTDPEKGGVPIFARVRLDEYMEIGPDAGKKAMPDGETKRATPLVGGADINDVTTWETHIPSDLTGECENGDTDTFHDYWNWEMGGETVYMPTFNKNKDSLKADINGTYDGADGDPATGEPFDDYQEYTAGDKITGNAVYDADDNDEDEENPVEDVNITTVREEHTAKNTQLAQVITMEDWMAMDAPTGKFWVYDTDGWAYWAEALMPGEATGLLLDGIAPQREPDDNWYYSINVVGQFATRGDWGQKDGTGFYDESQGLPPSNDALFLLNQAADLLPEITKISIAEGNKTYAKPGETLTLTPEVKVRNATGNAAETAVSWSVDPVTNSFQGGAFTPTEDMVGKTYRVTVTSNYDNSFTAYTDVYVYPADAVGVEKGEIDRKTYVKYADNTFREMKEDGSLGGFVSAGQDNVIGNSDDKAPVYLLKNANGEKYLRPNDDNVYYGVGADGLLGTSDDNMVEGGAEVTAAGNASSVKAGKTLAFSSNITLGGAALVEQDVVWTVSGENGKAAGTTINENGVLTVGSNEADKNVLTIRATSTVAPGVYGETTVNVVSLDAIKNITPGSTETINIDGIDWYVLAKDGNKALMWSKESIQAWGNNTGKASFSNSSNIWKDSQARTWLNNDFLNSLTILKDFAMESSISTRKEYTSNEEWFVTTDKIFLLSEADLFGTHSGETTTDARDYTHGTEQLVTEISMRKCESKLSSFVWLRSPRSTTNNVAGVTNSNGTSGNNAYSNVQGGIRPALWVDIS